jgi:hypothetical protein
MHPRWGTKVWAIPFSIDMYVLTDKKYLLKISSKNRHLSSVKKLFSSLAFVNLNIFMYFCIKIN